MGIKDVKDLIGWIFNRMKRFLPNKIYYIFFTYTFQFIYNMKYRTWLLLGPSNFYEGTATTRSSSHQSHFLRGTPTSRMRYDVLTTLFWLNIFTRPYLIGNYICDFSRLFYILISIIFMTLEEIRPSDRKIGKYLSSQQTLPTWRAKTTTTTKS